MYGSKIIKVYLFTYICKLLKCISIDNRQSRTNQWSEMEHTNYENQVYLLLLFIFIIQTYIPFFLFLLLKLSTNMFNSTSSLNWQAWSSLCSMIGSGVGGGIGLPGSCCLKVDAEGSKHHSPELRHE